MFWKSYLVICLCLIIGCKQSIQTQLDSRSAPTLKVFSYNVFDVHGYTKPLPINIFKKLYYRYITLSQLIKELLVLKSDIVCFQEAPPNIIVKFIAYLLGNDFVFLDGKEPGALLTSLKIVEHEVYSNDASEGYRSVFSKHCGRVLLQTENYKIAVYSLHLDHQSFQTRETEILTLLGMIKKDLNTGLSVLVLGDFNHTPDSQEYSRWENIGLIDCYSKNFGNQIFTFRNMEPSQRVDYIWVGGPLTVKLETFRIIDTQPFSTVFNGKQEFALSDHLPVMATFNLIN